VEQLRQALEREQKQCAHYQAEAQRCRAALLVYEHDHMRNRALIRLREQSLSDAATRHRLRSDASLAELRAQHVAALRIQSGMRGHAARSQVARQKDALLTIQSCARALLATRRVKNLRALREASAMRIQSRYRGHVAKQEVSKQKHSAAVIQAGVRGARDRQRNNDWMLQARKERHENALLIQATFRAARQKRMYKGLKRAVQVRVKLNMNTQRI
jgi:myosin heavy subunit